MLSLAVAQSSSDDNATCYVLPVFVEDVMFVHNGPHGAWVIRRILKVTHQGAERGRSHDVYDRLVFPEIIMAPKKRSPRPPSAHK